MNARTLLPLLFGFLQDATPPSSPPRDFEVATLELDAELVSAGRLGGVCVDREGTVFVTAFGADVWSVSPEGRVRTLASDFQEASGNAVAPDGSLLQADFARRAIYQVDVETGDSEAIVTSGLAGPVGLAVDEDWNLFVCDCKANAVLEVVPDGTVRTLASGALFACPNGIARDADGSLYVVSFANDLLVRIDATGQATTVATVGAGGGNAHVALAGGAVYVTKIETNELFEVSLTGDAKGKSRRVAGTGEPELLDGVGEEAALRHPNGLAAGPKGEWLYTNNIRGEWRGTKPTEMLLRKVRLP